MKDLNKSKTDQFDSNGVGLNNGHFIGLPYEETESAIVLIAVPWDVTVSFGSGTSTGARNILECSAQLDLYDADAPDIWQRGVYLRPIDEKWLTENNELRIRSEQYIQFLESGGQVKDEPEMQATLDAVNRTCAALKDWVKAESKQLLQKGKIVGIVGGEHAVPLGFLEALAEQYDSFGILQIDAHKDLRKAYEGFTYSHASIFHNAMKIEQILKLVQVGIRDYCDAELDVVKKSEGRIAVFYDQEIRRAQYRGESFHQVCQTIIDELPQHVYISFDIDGLDPKLCPNTGTPVPGGLDIQEAFYLLKLLVDSGRTIIGFDLCEVAGDGNQWDGNVGARILYKLCCLASLTH